MLDERGVAPALPRGTRTATAIAALPWLAMALFFAAPLVAVRDSWLFTFVAQTAVMAVFALSYNLLLGETGLLSFGHAAYAGGAAFVAAHVFNRGGFPLPLLPLVGAAAGAVLGALFGIVATQRSKTAFAMITLGIGELAAAAAWALPEGLGGASGIAIDRAAGPPLLWWTFGPVREAYLVIVVWALLSIAAMFVLTRTPLARMANAVRDNAPRVASLGMDPRRIRYAMFVASACFAGVAGTLGLINVEVASAEGVGMARSGAALIATVIGGAATFFGPVTGAVLLTFLSTAVAGVSRAWPLYLGLIFVGVVMFAPDGIAGALARRLSRPAYRGVQRRRGWRAWRENILAGIAALALGLALITSIESLYARQFSGDAGGIWHLGMLTIGASAPSTWIAVVALGCIGIGAVYRLRRTQARDEEAAQR